MHIENDSLIVSTINGENVTVPLTLDGRAASVRAWSVPTDYRSSGIFVSIAYSGDDVEIPACSQAHARYIGMINVDETPAARLEAAKERARAQINSTRDNLETAGFPYAGRRLDSDELSVQRISITVQAAQAAVAAGQQFAVEWVCQDNTTLALDANGVIGMPVAFAMHANALHMYGRGLKSKVDAADSIENLAEIDIHAGWPA